MTNHFLTSATTTYRYTRIWWYIYSLFSALHFIFTTEKFPVPIWKEVGHQGSFREEAKGSTLFSSCTARILGNILSYAGFTVQDKHSYRSWERFADSRLYLRSHFQKVKILRMWPTWDISYGLDPISSLTSLWLPSSFLLFQRDENWNSIQFLFSTRKSLSQ
jgi:hypothetical protein